ncbi:colicin-like bacteriocin tRNase domain-containing protein [Serratia liquefaciens]|uniref:colicin-like bacteriocin tRNase domain-containing protein n=1 Tax=Serratia liquefaciens TaxID=614 RepID=UPI003B3A9F4B
MRLTSRLTAAALTFSAPETVAVHTRVLDDVHDGTQYISAVSVGAAYDLPIVKATAGFYLLAA